MVEKFTIPQVDEKEFKEKIVGEVELGFETLKIFLDSKSIAENQDRSMAVNRLFENLHILNLKENDWKNYGLDITKERLNSLIEEYKKAEMEELRNG